MRKESKKHEDPVQQVQEDSQRYKMASKCLFSKLQKTSTCTRQEPNGFLGILWQLGMIPGILLLFRDLKEYYLRGISEVVESGKEYLFLVN